MVRAVQTRGRRPKNAPPPKPGGRFLGVIARVRAARGGDGDGEWKTMCHVRYDDGDEEDVAMEERVVSSTTTIDTSRRLRVRHGCRDGSRRRIRGGRERRGDDGLSRRRSDRVVRRFARCRPIRRRRAIASRPGCVPRPERSEAKTAVARGTPRSRPGEETEGSSAARLGGPRGGRARRELGCAKCRRSRYGCATCRERAGVRPDEILALRPRNNPSRRRARAFAREEARETPPSPPRPPPSSQRTRAPAAAECVGARRRARRHRRRGDEGGLAGAFPRGHARMQQVQMRVAGVPVCRTRAGASPAANWRARRRSSTPPLDRVLALPAPA